MTKSKKKILYVSHAVFPSDKANAAQSLEMAKGFHRNGDLIAFVGLLSPGATEENVKVWALEQLGIEISFAIHLMPVTGSQQGLARFRQFVQLVKFVEALDVEATVIYLRDYMVYLAFVRKFKSLVFEIHQWNFYPSSFINRLLRLLLSFLIKGKRTIALVCISEVLRERWARLGIDKNKLLTAHDCIDESFFREDITRRTAREMLNLGEEPLVLYTGSLYANRSVDWYFDVAKASSDLLVEVIGGGNEEVAHWQSKVRATSLANLSYRAKKSRNGLIFWFFAADVLVFSMSTETRTYDICSPLKIFEYMAVGKIIVAPDLENLREVLKDDYAEFYEIDNRASFVSAVQNAVARQKSANWCAGKRARQVALGEFTWTRRAVSVKRHIFELIDNRR